MVHGAKPIRAISEAVDELLDTYGRLMTLEQRGYVSDGKFKL